MTSSCHRTVVPQECNGLGKPRAIDLFCSAGGSSWGARNAGAQLVAGFDMWKLAGEVYHDNFPEAKFFEGKLEDCDLEAIAKELGPIDLIVASPECTRHSLAKGNSITARDEESKETALQVTRFARFLETEMDCNRECRRYALLESIRHLYCRPEELRLQCESPDAQLRQLRRSTVSTQALHNVRPSTKACESRALPHSVRLGARYHKPEWKIPILAAACRWTCNSHVGACRNRAIRALGEDRPFLLVYYGSDRAGGWQSLDAPLRTITTLDRFAFVRPDKEDHSMRMLQPPELQAAMGIPQRFRLRRGTRREKVKLLGNAVCPPVMKRVVKTLIGEGPINEQN